MGLGLRNVSLAGFGQLGYVYLGEMTPTACFLLSFSPSAALNIIGLWNREEEPGLSSALEMFRAFSTEIAAAPATEELIQLFLGDIS